MAPATSDLDVSCSLTTWTLPSGRSMWMMSVAAGVSQAKSAGVRHTPCEWPQNRAIQAHPVPFLRHRTRHHVRQPTLAIDTRCMYRCFKVGGVIPSTIDAEVSVDHVQKPVACCLSVGQCTRQVLPTFRVCRSLGCKTLCSRDRNRMALSHHLQYAHTAPDHQAYVR